MTDYATLEKIDDVSVLSLDDGKVNVFSIEMLEASSISIEKTFTFPSSKLNTDTSSIFSRVA